MNIKTTELPKPATIPGIINEMQDCVELCRSDGDPTVFASISAQLVLDWIERLSTAYEKI